MSTSGAAPAGGPPSGAAGGDLAGVYPAPSVAKIQGTAVSAVAPTNGQLFQLVGGVWTPATLVIPAPAASVTGPDAFGVASAVGVSTAYARQDHDHGLPANPAPAPSGVVTGPDAFGAAAVVGTSAAFSRGDHNHGLPANPTPAFASPSIALGTAAAAGAAGTVIRSDATIAAFDATAPVTQALGDAAAVGAAAVTARRDHRHGMPALASTVVGPDAFGAAPAVGTSVLPARADHDHGLPAAAGGGRTLISSNVLASAVSTLTLSSIPGTFAHLRLEMLIRSQVAATTDALRLQFNGDTGANYLVSGTGGQSFAVGATFMGATGGAGAGDFTGYWIDIPFYTSITYNKLVRAIRADSVANLISTIASSWNNAAIAAITSIRVFAATGPFVIGCAFNLYGLS